MALTYNNEQHRVYLDFTDSIGRNWVEVFAGDTDFYDANFWDLFKSMWRAGGTMRKTDALKAMTALKSAHTAGKYLGTAIAQGYIAEEDNPADARSKLVRLSPEMTARLDAFFDRVTADMLAAADDVAAKGPSPERS